MINVYIVSGFLGAGKTTFIKKLLEGDVFKKAMLIENEFGEVGIDGSLFDSALKVKEINSGCICCSLKGDLVDALDEIKGMDIDSLLIEPSGVGKLSEIMMTIMQDDDFRLASHIAMVDAKKALSYHHNFKEFFDDQVIAANAIVLSKLDTVDSKRLEETKEMLSELNDEVVILDKPYMDMEASELFKLMTEGVCDCEECTGCMQEDEIEEHCHCHDHHDHDCHHDHDHECGHHHHHDADEIFTSIAINTERVFAKDELIDILKKMPETIVRIKGIVKGDERYLYFDKSGDDIMVSRADATRAGTIVIIGTEVDKEFMEGLFK